MTNNYNKKGQGIIITLFISCFALMLCLMAMKSTISLFILSLGGTTFIAGMLSTALVVCGLVVKPIVGFAMDRVGSKPLFYFAAFITIFSSLAHYISSGNSILVFGILGIVLAGIAFSMMNTIIVPLFLLCSKNQDRNKYMINLAGLNTVLITAAAPTMSQEIINRWGFQPLYLIFIAISLVGILLNVSIKSKLSGGQAIAPENEMEAKKSSIFKVILNKPFLLLFLVNVTWGMTNGLLLTFLIPYGVEKGINNTGLFFTLYSAINILLRWLVPYFMDKIGKKLLIILSLTFMIPGTLLLAFITKQTDLILPALLSGIGTCAIFTPLVSLVLDYLPEKRKMSGLGIFLAAFEVGQGLTSLLVGIMSITLNYATIFAIIGLIPLIGIGATAYLGTKGNMYKNKEFKGNDVEG